MSTNDPLDPRNTGGSSGAGDTHNFGDVQISTGRQSAYVTIELIVYALAVIGVFIASAVVDENDDGSGFSASQAWFYVTLLTVGFLISRGLAKINARGDSNRVL
jgi:hypothetical protein